MERHSAVSRLRYCARELPTVSTVGVQLLWAALPAARKAWRTRIEAILRSIGNLLGGALVAPAGPLGAARLLQGSRALQRASIRRSRGTVKVPRRSAWLARRPWRHQRPTSITAPSRIAIASIERPATAHRRRISSTRSMLLPKASAARRAGANIATRAVPGAAR